jgi:hypothetical protein
MDWISGLLQLGACLLLYGLWRLLGWQLEKRRERIPWNRLRNLGPSFMLLWGWP